MFKVTRTSEMEASVIYWLGTDDEPVEFGVIVPGPDCEASQEIMGSVVLGLALLDEMLGEEEGGEPKAGRQRGRLRAWIAKRRDRVRSDLSDYLLTGRVTQAEHDDWIAKLDKAEEEAKTGSVLLLISLIGLMLNIFTFLRARREHEWRREDRED